MNNDRQQRHSKKSGMPPGSLVYTGVKTFPTSISMVQYDADNFRLLKGLSIREAIDSIGKDSTNWLIISGFEDIAGLETLGTHFGIHPLIMEDIFNVQHMPKVEDDGTSVFITLKSLIPKEKTIGIESEQISLYLSDNVLLTFLEKETRIFDPIIERLNINKGKGRLRQEDFLAYLLIDNIVDNYFLSLDHLEDQIEQVEQMLLKNPANELTTRFLSLKKYLVQMRRTVYPLKEAIRYISKEDTDIIGEVTRQHLSDIHDHLNFIIQSLDSYREMIATMMDLQAASNSNRMNSIMKTLTVVSTIFIPLSFAAGIYGMNFHHMPELEWKYGYQVFLLANLVIGFGMYFYMKRRKWF